MLNKLIELFRQNKTASHGRKPAPAVMSGEHQANARQAETLKNSGNRFVSEGDLKQAEKCYRQAISIRPDYAEAHSNLGLVLWEQENLAEALLYSGRAIVLKPDLQQAYSNLGNIHREMGRLSAAETSYRQALTLNPSFALAHSNLLFCLSQNEAVNADELFAEHCRFSEKFEAPLRADWPRHGNSRDPERCLQIGFVSADLCNHAVANFIEPLMAYLSGYSQLSLHAYYNRAAEDEITHRLRGYFRCWHPIEDLSEDALAQQIREDHIDILIDLSGHTAKHRLLCFARKPAPLQISWIGYPGTTGLKAMDYYLSDRIFLPPGQFDEQFTEKIVHLPVGVPFLPHKDAPPVNTLPAASNGYLTFGSFNQLSKLNRSVIVLWAQLLRALPGSRMLLGAMPRTGANDTLVEWFEGEGIDRTRLSFHPRCQMKEYLELHHQVDLCLDSFPYNGGTTTNHAFWMGVPTITLAGGTVPSRVGATLLSHAGLEAFVAHDKQEFVDKGLYWAGHLAELSQVRDGLRGHLEQFALSQPATVAAALECALRTMWQRWCAGSPAESFEVPLPGRNHPTQEADA